MGETITSTFIVSTFRNHLNTVLYARMACDNCHNCICSFCDNYLPQLKCDNYDIFTSDNLAGEKLSQLFSFFNCSVCDENQVAPRWEVGRTMFCFETRLSSEAGMQTEKAK